MDDVEINITALLRDDRCPQCVPKTTELPASVELDRLADCLVCEYACDACGYAWSTEWSIGALTGVWPGQ